MNSRRLSAVAAAGLLVSALALTGCGSRASTGAPAATKVATIGVVAPLSGDLAAMGAGIRNSVDLAVKQANEKNTIPGWELRIDAQDDQASPDAGKNAATKLTSDATVVGIVGPLNSSVGQAIQPITQAAGIAEVSPANTNPSLTRGADLTQPVRTYDNYFRTCTTDAVQGPFAAQYLLDSGVKKVATIHDKKAYGQGLVTNFTKAFTDGGGTIVDAETINPDDKDFSSVISKVKSSNPEAIYYGGEYPQSGPLSQQLKAAGLKVPLMGGDGMYDPAYIDLAGAASNGDLVTSVGAPADTLASAKDFVNSYQAAAYPAPYGAYGAYSYDSANAIIEALKVSLADANDASSARKATIEALGNVDFQGASGSVSFDGFGDNKSRILTVYKVQDGTWTAVKTADFQ